MRATWPAYLILLDLILIILHIVFRTSFNFVILQSISGHACYHRQIMSMNTIALPTSQHRVTPPRPPTFPCRKHLKNEFRKLNCWTQWMFRIKVHDRPNEQRNILVCTVYFADFLLPIMTSLNCGCPAPDKRNQWLCSFNLRTRLWMGGTEKGLHEVTSLLLRSLTPKRERATARLSSFIGFPAAHEVRFRFPWFLALVEIVNNWILASWRDRITNRFELWSTRENEGSKTYRMTEWSKWDSLEL
jgi:hypothetical protein